MEKYFLYDKYQFTTLPSSEGKSWSKFLNIECMCPYSNKNVSGSSSDKLANFWEK